jgi:hypothetical protein
MPPDMDRVSDDFGPDQCEGVLPSVRLVLWLQFASAASWWCILLLAPRWAAHADAGCIVVPASSLLLLLVTGRAGRRAVTGVGSRWYEHGWSPYDSMQDNIWYQRHYHSLLMGRWWALCKRRTADRVLFVASYVALSSPWVWLVGVVARLAWREWTTGM